MMVPEHVLLALNNLLSNDDTGSKAPPERFGRVYSTVNGRSTCFIRSKDFVDWMAVPFSENRDSKTDGTLDWHQNSCLADEFRKSRKIGESSEIVEKLFGDTLVLQRDSNENVLCIPLERFQLVAALLHDYGQPPLIVTQDWMNQLNSMKLVNASAHPAETFVTEDGILVPISDSIQQWLDATSIALEPRRFRNSVQSDEVNWPWHASQPQTEPTQTSTKQPNTHQASTRLATESLPWLAENNSPINSLMGPVAVRNKRSKRTYSSQRVMIAIATIGVLLLGSTVWLFSGSSSKREANSNGTNTSKKSNPKATESSVIQSVENLSLNNATTDDQELMTIDDITDMAKGASSNLESETVDTLLAKLQPTELNSFRLSSGVFNPSSIISDALSGVRNTTSNDTSAEDTNDPDRDDNDPIPIENNAAPDGTLSFEKTISIDASPKKETIVIGSRVSPKLSRCVIELRVSKNLVVEPTGPVTLEGIDKATWKIAIEDEEPELIVEISSKPGTRWQLNAVVGLRETSTASPVIFAPRDAQNVGNRLVDYNQWINNSIAVLQNAKANQTSRSRIDFYGEIKKLERQQRELEKAIGQWKIIAKLSHLFYDDNELQAKLTIGDPPKR